MSESDAAVGTRTDDDALATVALGDCRPAGSRHMWQRSAVLLDGERAVVGTVGGEVSAVPLESVEDADAPSPAWTTPIDDEYVVSLATPTDRDAIAVGGRGERGAVTAIDAATGERRWSYRTAEDLGDPQKDSLFFLPYVVDAAADDERVYAAARRYERDADAETEDGARQFRSAVYAFEPDGSVAWTYRADASPIAIDLREDRLAVAYNRCTGDHQCGLVVLDAETGDARLTWDPGTEGQRRVGDVALLDDGVAVACHGDYRGYRLDERGGIRWSVDLARPTEVGDETLYAYPNHVHATSDGVAFVTGNTYPAEGREAEGRHPNEHAIAAVAPDGAERWRASVGGWVSELAADGSAIAAPCAQHFRDRDPDTHSLRRFDLVDGPGREAPIRGVGTAASLTDEYAAVVEEPVEYHDGDAVRGAYRLHLFD